MLVVEFESLADVKKVYSLLEKNIGQLNKSLPNYEFVKRDIFLDCYLFENIRKNV